MTCCRHRARRRLGGNRAGPAGSRKLGLLKPINRLATMSVDPKVLDVPVDVQEVAGGLSRGMSGPGRKASWPGGAGASPGR